MSRRRRNDNPFTLFAFQDIITAVTGILILITLILALSLVNNPLNESEESRQDMQALRSQLASLQADVVSLEEQTDVDSEMIDLMTQFGADSIDQLVEKLKDSIARSRHLVEDSTLKNADSANKVQEIRSRVDQEQISLDQLVQRIRNQQELLRKIVDSNRIVYQFPGARGDEPWLIDVGSQQWLAAPANKKQKPERFDHADLDQRLQHLESWFRTAAKNRKYLVLLVRPDGVESYKLIRNSTSLDQAEFGVDLIAADITVIDSQTGAVIQ